MTLRHESRNVRHDIKTLESYFQREVQTSPTGPPVGIGHKVKVTGQDKVPDFLLSKLQAGEGVSLTRVNPGADESIRIDSDIAATFDSPGQIEAGDSIEEGESPNLVRADHQHGLVSSSNPLNNEVILQSDTDGRLRIEGLGIGTYPQIDELRLAVDVLFEGAGSIATTLDSLVLEPAESLILEPGNDVQIKSDLATDNWFSQTTGWGITYAGHADFRSIFADELQVEDFIAANHFAFAGGIILTKSRAIVSRNFVVPDKGQSATLYVEDLEGYPGVPVFADNDYIRLRIIDRANGGLLVSDVYGQVTDYTDQLDGEQSWSFTTTRSIPPDDLTSDNLEAATSTLNQPGLSQTHSLSANSLITALAELDVPQVGLGPSANLLWAEFRI